MKERQLGEINSLKTQIAQAEVGKGVLYQKITNLQLDVSELTEALTKRGQEADKNRI